MFLGNVLFIPNQKQLEGKTLKMKLSRSTLGTLVAAGIKPATSWFEGLPLCSLAQQQHNTKELAELFSTLPPQQSDVKAWWCWNWWDFAFPFIPEQVLCGRGRDETDAAHLKDCNWLSRAAVRAEICRRASTAPWSAQSHDLLQRLLLVQTMDARKCFRRTSSYLGSDVGFLKQPNIPKMGCEIKLGLWNEMDS